MFRREVCFFGMFRIQGLGCELNRSEILKKVGGVRMDECEPSGSSLLSGMSRIGIEGWKQCVNGNSLGLRIFASVITICSIGTSHMCISRVFASKSSNPFDKFPIHAMKENICK
ncbi:hypothetical protein NPIL_485711 [Nephila pilipes]|uniref:Uncharacterized protein n=1 Tax=Nephila pilipes TaxID=299642 RepID=A0A8X6R8D7_NEPPI|nr:hypothetical protein NPIL_485711 [Nephila pilipes]